MATVSTESAHVPFPIGQVWRLLRPLDQLWTGMVTGSRVAGDSRAAEVGSLRELTFTEGTQQTVQLTELSDDRHQLTYSLVSSTPSVSVLGASHSLRLFRVTSDNSTVVEWTSRYPTGTGADVVEDSRWKKLDAFQNLVKVLQTDRRQVKDVWDRFAATEVAKVFSTLPPQAALSEQDLGRLWDRFDENQDGVLSCNELEALVSEVFEYMSNHIPSRLKELIEYNDMDDEERKDADARMAPITEQLAQAERKAIAEELMTFMDLDKSGTVDRKEFIATFQDAMLRAVKKYRTKEAEDDEE